MKRLLFFLLFLPAGVFGQIVTNTPFEPRTPNPIDVRMVIATLNDTLTITDLFEGLLTHVNDIDQYYKYNGSNWELFSATMTDEQVETAYNNQVSIVSQAIAEAGTSTTVHRWTPERVRQAIEALAPSQNSIDSTHVSNDSMFIYSGGVGYFVGPAPSYFTPDQFGAIRDDGIDDSAAIAAAFAAAPEGSTILFKTGEYTVANDIFMRGKSMELTGFGATIKRANQLIDTLIEAAPTTQSFVRVSNADTFAVDDTVIFLDPGGLIGGIGERDHSSELTITSISGDTIFLDNPLNTPFSDNIIPATYPVGTKMVRTFVMFDVSEDRRYLISKLRFDGNRANNSASLSWKHSRTINRIGNGSRITGCQFIEIPTENIYANESVTITDNYANGGNGSFVHTTGVNALPGKNVYSGNIIIDFTQVSTDTMGHNEAVFVCSARSDSITITDNFVINTTHKGNGFYGTSNNDDNIQTIMGNFAANLNFAIDLRIQENAPNPIAEPGPVIIGNTFYNCEGIFCTLAAGATDPTDGEVFVGTILANNHLINTRVFLFNQIDMVFNGNHIRFDSAYIRTIELVTDRSALQLSGSNIKITSNHLFNDHRSGASLEVGIFYGASLTPGLIPGTRYTLDNSMEISNNTIKGFNRCVDIDANATAPQDEARFNINIHDNILFQRDSTSASGNPVAAIYPGVAFFNNSVFKHSSGSNGLRVRGVASSQSAVLNGPIAYNNRFFGGGESIEIGRGGADGYNSTVVNNFYDGTIDWNDLGTNGNNVTGNIKLPVVETPPLTWLTIIRN